jgi:bifunctional DNase/RNase
MRRAALALVLGGSLLLPTPARPAEVDVDVAGVEIDLGTGAPVVRLVERTDEGTPRELLIWIGPAEAQAIALEMHGVPTPRPLTHDLMTRLVRRLGGKLDRVVVEALRGDTYIASIHLRARGGRRLRVDARPSDAIALALRLGGPIRVADELLGAAPPSRAVRTAHLWGLTLQDLTPEVAAFFDVAPGSGVLVADVGSRAELERGDVITALDGRRVGTLDELRSGAGSRAAATPVQLAVTRGGRTLTVQLPAE